jgi:hypothetical protein
MKDLIRKIIKEISVDKKERMGRGSFHDVYPLKYDSDKVVKVPRSKDGYAASEYLESGSDSWFNIFKKYPQYFPEVYKITDKYIILEKLDTNRVKQDLIGMEDELVSISPTFSNMIEEINYGVTEVLDGLVMGKLSGINEDIKMLNMLIKKSYNKDIFKRYIDLLLSIRGERIRDFIDVNDGNFGYNKEGKLKMLDI